MVVELRARVRGRPHADPVRALQRRPEVRDARGAGRGARRRPRRDRTLRAGRARRRAGRYLLKRGARRGEGSVVLPVHADAGAARARDVSGRRARQAGGPRRWRASSAWRCRRSRTATRSASSPTATTPLPRAARRRDGRPAPSATSPAASSARHDGVHRFTVGQRKGLGLSSPVPLYVVGIDAEQGAVTVGPREALERATLTASGVNWIAGDAAGARHPRRPRRSATATARRPVVDHAAGRRPRARRRSTSRSTPSRRARRSCSTTAMWCWAGGGSTDVDVQRVRPCNVRTRRAVHVARATSCQACSSASPRCCGTPSRYFSASIAAMQPDPAAVIACR